MLIEKDEISQSEDNSSETGEALTESTSEDPGRVQVKFSDHRLVLDKYRRNRKLTVKPETVKTPPATKEGQDRPQEGQSEDEQQVKPLPEQLQALIESASTQEFSLANLTWLDELSGDLQKLLFKQPRKDKLQMAFKKEHLSSSKREFRKANGWFKKFIELEVLCEALDTSKDSVRCHVVCPGIGYGLGRGLFARLMRRLWVNGGQETRIKASWADMGREWPMIHWQDLAMGVKWLVMRPAQPGKDCLGFFESVFENDFRDVFRDKGDNIKKNLLTQVKKKRRRLRCKDSYILFSDQEKGRTIGHRVERVLGGFYNFGDTDPKIQFEEFDAKREEILKFGEAQKNVDSEVAIEFPFGFQGLGREYGVCLFNQRFQKSFRTKRSTFLDKAPTAKPWEEILRERRGDSLPLGELQKETDQDAPDEPSGEEASEEEPQSEAEGDMEEPEPEEFDFEDEGVEDESDESESEEVQTMPRGSKNSIQRLPDLADDK